MTSARSWLAGLTLAAFVVPAAASGQDASDRDAANLAADHEQDGKWLTAEEIPTFKVAEDGTVDWTAALAAYEAVRPEHCRRVLTTSRKWGELWHLDGLAREQRNVLLRARDTYDYSFVDWLYGPTALTPEEEPELFTPIPLSSAQLPEPAQAVGTP